MCTVSVNNQIQHREAEISKNERHKRQKRGQIPLYPTNIVFLGEKAMDALPFVTEILEQKWPEYQKEICTHGIPSPNQDCFRDSHFSNKCSLVSYYLLDTTGFRKEVELDCWLKGLRKFMKQTGIKQENHLVVLLDEVNASREMTKALRKRLLEYNNNPSAFGNCSSLLLLSNQLDDGTRLSSWESCYHIMVDFMIMTNCENADIRLQNKKLISARYRRLEKPVCTIAGVSLLAMLKNFDDVYQPQIPQLTLEQLGMRENGTFTILDSYSEELAKLLPTKEDLKWFAMKDYKENSDLSQLTWREFSVQSYGVLLYSLKNDPKLLPDKKCQEAWKSAYRQQICKGISTATLQSLAEPKEQERLKELFFRQASLDDTKPVLEAAREWLQLHLSEMARDLFLSVIKDQGEQAMAYVKEWKSLLRETENLCTQKIDGLDSYYRNKTNDFLLHNAAQYKEILSHTMDVDALCQTLKDAMRQLIAGDSAFTASFEEEWSLRMQTMGRPGQAGEQIFGELTHELPSFLPGVMSTSELLSAVLLKTETSLHESLKNNFPASVSFYDTGLDSCVEYIKFFAVNQAYLLSELEGI